VSVHVALRGVTRVFPATKQQAEVKALGPIDLDLVRGEFFAVGRPIGLREVDAARNHRRAEQPDEGHGVT
jgi:hypothetical protein